MRSITALLLLFVLAGLAFAQNEQTEIVEKEFAYRNWKYKNVGTDGKTDLREFAKGKKLVMVVYWAPWCNNWKHDVAFVQQLHDKYKSQGLAVIGVSNYDSVDRMKNHIEFYKLTFPNVYETESAADRLKSEHYTDRTAAGDTRRWGTPWYVFLEPGQIAANGDTLATKMNVANGELIPDKAESFIRQKLGLGENKTAAVSSAAAIEACEAEKKSAALIKP
ncbi:MAG: TlpA disulfide reductase family protein [Pyrinomonadaceae bacterium]|nr:TlpA disulfide reductase family protein [Pyrinomonadaceae bacterium]